MDLPHHGVGALRVQKWTCLTCACQGETLPPSGQSHSNAIYEDLGELRQDSSAKSHPSFCQQCRSNFCTARPNLRLHPLQRSNSRAFKSRSRLEEGPGPRSWRIRLQLLAVSHGEVELEASTQVCLKFPWWGISPLGSCSTLSADVWL